MAYTWDANKNKTSESITGVMSGYGFTSAGTTYDNEDLCISSSLPPPASSLLVNIDANGTADVNFQYVALGRRVARSGTGGSEVYVQMDQQTIADYPVGGAATTPTFRYVYASYIDEPVVRKGPTSTSTVHFYHRNHQYSVTAITTSAGSIAERYAYSAYGQPTILDASASVLSSSAINNRYTYTGREWDATLGLHHFRARWMSPSAGRFLGRDPIGYDAGVSVYQFLRSRILVRLDPTGTVDINCHCSCIREVSGRLEDSFEATLTVECPGLARDCCFAACEVERRNRYGEAVQGCEQSSCTFKWKRPGTIDPDIDYKPCDEWNQSKSNCLTFCSEGYTTCMEIGIASCILTGRSFLNCATAAGIACQIAYGSVCQRYCNQCLNP
jgi:RHS repeat-associated protein